MVVVVVVVSGGGGGGGVEEFLFQSNSWTICCQNSLRGVSVCVLHARARVCEPEK